jgi:putative DNA primase/helicase
MSALEYAMDYLAAGISVLPLRCDGSKCPGVSTWKQLQSRLATNEEAKEWFVGRVGIGVITGSVSGNLEVIDFDMHQLLAPVLALLPSALVEKLAVYETPGGWHVAYRCESVSGNTKIAMWEPLHTPSRGKCYGPPGCGKGVRIETRGEGGYIVAEGSSLETHSSGLPYCHYMGPRLESVQTISKDERKMLWLACNEFDLSSQKENHIAHVEKKITASKETKFDIEMPWDWFDVVGNWDWILLPLGWKKCGNNSYTRPGKSHGVSAVVFDNNGLELLKVYSTSVSGSEHKSLGKFNALVEYKFSGNRSEAARFVSDLKKGS